MPWRDQFKSKEEYNAWFRKYFKKNRKKTREYKRIWQYAKRNDLDFRKLLKYMGYYKKYGGK